MAQTGSFTPDDLARLPEIVAADLAPDAGSTVYAATTRDGTTAVERTLLWRYELGGKPELLLDRDGSQSAPAFSPDGGRLAFLLTEDGGKRQLAVLDLADRSLEVLTGFDRGVGAQRPVWSPDGATLAFTACDEPARDPSRPYRVTRPVWRHDGMGLVEDVKADLWTVPSSGGTATRLTHHDGVVGQVQWSPDGTALLYDCFAEPGTAAVSLRTVAADGSSTHTVLSSTSTGWPPTAAWLPDGRVVRTSDFDVYNVLDLLVHDPATGADTPLELGLAGQLGGMVVTGANDALMEFRLLVDPGTADVITYVQTGGRLELVRISTTDKSCEVVRTGDFSIAPVALRGRSVLVASTSFADPFAVAVLDLDSGEEVAGSALDRGWLAEPPFTVHELHFQGADGTPVEGWFLEPRGGEGPYPTVLHIHGGPFAVHGHGFSIDNHLFTSAGYGVLMVNFRMSSGYGEEFAKPLSADWGNQDAADLHAGLDHAIAQGLVDPDRIGSFGLSGGGFMTSWLLTHSDRFAAGIAECPVTDWHGMIGSDIPQVVGKWMGSEPGHGPESLVPFARMSPATYAASCAAPMLIVEHEADLRCPVNQGDVLFNALNLAGLPTEMLRLPGMFHTDVYGVADLPARQERLGALTEWFDRHLTR